MSKTKHTPGPWISDGAGDNCDRFRFVIAESGHIICRLRLIRRGNTEANARLIAAAPELLEAAIELKDVCNRPSAARTRAEAWRKLDKAIAKATGEQ